jgi:hypothetical protein
MPWLQAQDLPVKLLRRRYVAAPVQRDRARECRVLTHGSIVHNHHRSHL